MGGKRGYDHLMCSHDYVFHIFPSMQDRIPADGVVRAGRSSVDESSFTGEPLPVTKLPGVMILPQIYFIFVYPYFLQ